MSEIPSNIAASGAQAGFQSAETSKTRDAQRAAQTRAAQRGVQSIDDAGNIIEAGDEDTAVFADAEGAGGQGRSDEQESHEDHGDDDPAAGSGGGITTGNDGKPHLDIQA